MSDSSDSEVVDTAFADLLRRTHSITTTAARMSAAATLPPTSNAVIVAVVVQGRSDVTDLVASLTVCSGHAHERNAIHTAVEVGVGTRATYSVCSSHTPCNVLVHSRSEVGVGALSSYTAHLLRLAHCRSVVRVGAMRW